MKIFSWNVNGLRAVCRKELFLPFIKAHQPDILCLQETKAKEHQNPLDLPEYEEYWNSAAREGYSGTAIFTKQKPLSVAFDIPQDLSKKYRLEKDKYGNPNQEGRLVAAEYKNFYVVSVYTPNAKDDLSRIPLRQKQWDPAFLEYMQILEQKKPVIFGGDFNVAHTPDDLARPKANVGRKGFTTEEREGINKMIEIGFFDTFRLYKKGNGHYTWWSYFNQARARNVGWRIDYFFVSNSLKPTIKEALIHADVMGSDHCPISITLE